MSALLGYQMHAAAIVLLKIVQVCPEDRLVSQIWEPVRQTASYSAATKLRRIANQENLRGYSQYDMLWKSRKKKTVEKCPQDKSSNYSLITAVRNLGCHRTQNQI